MIDYQIIFDRKHHKDHITVIVETESINNKIRKGVLAAIMKIPAIYSGVYDSKTIEEPVIKLVKPNTLDRDSLKAKRVIDKRNLYE